MAKVYFASDEIRKPEAESSLPAKFERMLKKLNVKQMSKNKLVALKMHTGGNIA